MASQLTLQILDGRLKSTIIPLRKNYVFSGDFFNDSEMKNEHAKTTLDHNFNWKINGLGGVKLRVGSDEVDFVTLIPGLIFHIGQTGFKVLQRPQTLSTNWEQFSADFVDSLDFQPTLSTDVFFFLFPVQVQFLQGPQAGTIYTLGYGPRILGSNNLDLDIKDPLQPHELLKFTQLGDQVVIENMANPKDVLVNKNFFTQHTLTSGDRFTFGSNIVEISILK